MNYTYINDIKSKRANPAVTLYINTNRTFPENNRDSINLKNRITEVEKRLEKEYGKKISIQITKKLKEFASEFKHNYNLESLIIFVSSDFLDFIKLPVKVTDKIIIDNKFAVKILLRSMLQTENYYVLCISRKIARLIEAVNDNAISEITNDKFPFQNESYIESDDIRKSWGNIYDNYAKEYFNKADKLLKYYLSRNPKPVILAGDVRNISYYKEVANNKNMIIGSIEGNFDNKKNHEIVKQAFKVVGKHIKKEQKKALSEIATAQKEHKLLVDLNDIYRAVNNGNGLKLFVEKNYFQPAIIKNDIITLRKDPSEPGVIDDIINDIIDSVVMFGGKVMYLQNNQLKEYNRIALVTRY